MSQERMKILQMLEEGKVTANEATVLLERLTSSPSVTSDVATTTTVATGGQPLATAAEAPQPFQLSDWLQQLIAQTAKQQVEETFDWKLDRTGIETVAAQSINGAVTYVGAEQNEISVHAQKLVKAPDRTIAEDFARQVQIRIEPQAGTLRIYADYPRPPRNVEVQISFTIHGPRTINVHAQSTNGHVAVTEVEGEIHAQSTNGEVHLQGLTGWVEAKSTNGNVNVQQLTLTAASQFSSQNGTLVISVQQGQTPLTATTVNGSIRLSLPANYAGQIDARTHNGRVRTDFPTRPTEQTRNRLVGVIGAGGAALLKLRSQNGNVVLAPTPTP